MDSYSVDIEIFAAGDPDGNKRLTESTEKARVSTHYFYCTCQ